MKHQWAENQWERFFRMLFACMQMVIKNRRTIEMLANHLDIFLNTLMAHVDRKSSRSIRNEIYKADGDVNRADLHYNEFAPADVTYEYILCPHHYYRMVNADWRMRKTGVCEETPKPPTYKELIETVKKRKDVRLPDFAETEDFFEKNPDEKHKLIISLCGEETPIRGLSRPAIAAISSYKGELKLSKLPLDTAIRGNKILFLVVKLPNREVECFCGLA